MFNWLKKRNQISDPQDNLRKQIRVMFNKLEEDSYWGEVRDEKTLARLNETIELAENLLTLMKQNPDVHGPVSLTQVYLASALDSRVNYYYHGQIIKQAGHSFHLVRELASEVRLNHPHVKEYLQKMLVDLNRLLCEEMKEDVGLRGLKLEWRCMCYRALNEYKYAIADAKQIVEQNGEDYESYILLSDCYWDYYNYDEAIKSATKAIEYAKDDLQRHSAWYHRGQINEEADNKAASDRDYQQAATFKSGAQEFMDRVMGRR